MIEKLENCPICGAALSQGEYDFQQHGDHWLTFPAIRIAPDCTCGADGSQEDHEPWCAYGSAT